MRNKLAKMLQYAKNNIIYYECYCKNAKSIEDYPVINKSLIRTAPEIFINREYNGDYDKNILRMYTSGSTGIPFNVLWDRKDLLNSYISTMLYRYRNYEITPQDKFIYFYGNRYINNTLLNCAEDYIEDDNSLGVNKRILYQLDVESLIKQIFKHKPKWMICQPSIAVMISKMLEQKYLNEINIKYVELTGETLNKYTREYIKKSFGANVSNLYSNTEINGIAMEDKNQNMYVIEENAHVEILDDKYEKTAEEGRIVVTSLCNHVMPFIRYDTGDIGRLHYKNGREILELKRGRNMSVIDIGLDHMITPYIFCEIIEKVNEQMFGSIIEFQVIRKKQNLFLYIICLDTMFKNWSSTISKAVLEHSKKMLPICDFEVEINEFIMSESDKHSCYVDECLCD